MIKVEQIGNIYTNPSRNVSFKNGPQSYELMSLKSDTKKADMVENNFLPAFNAKIEKFFKMFSPEVAQRTEKLTSALNQVNAQYAKKLDIRA